MLVTVVPCACVDFHPPSHRLVMLIILSCVPTCTSSLITSCIFCQSSFVLCCVVVCVCFLCSALPVFLKYVLEVWLRALLAFKFWAL